jgi:hypothetical protein
MEMFGLKYPIFEAPHGSATCPKLAIAVSNAGAMGALALFGSPEETRDAVSKVRSATKGSFLVNFILQFEPRGLQAALDAGAYIRERVGRRECRYFRRRGIVCRGGLRRLEEATAAHRFRDRPNLSIFETKRASNCRRPASELHRGRPSGGICEVSASDALRILGMAFGERLVRHPLWLTSNPSSIPLQDA